MLKVSQHRGVMEPQPNCPLQPKQRSSWASPQGDAQTGRGSQWQDWSCVPSDGTCSHQMGQPVVRGDGTLSTHGLVSSASITISFFIQITDKYIKSWSRAVGCLAVNLTSG